MHLTVRDVARLLRVTERTVYGWVRQGSIPSISLHGQYRFNRSELLEWATARKITVPPELMAEKAATEVEPVLSITDALKTGGIHHSIFGTTKAVVLRHVVEKIPFPPNADREMFLRVLMAREEMGSTGIGDGIAIPHVRNPIVLHIKEPIITLCFLAEPIDFDSIDGKWVHCLFTLVSPTIRTHLQVLSRLAFLLRDPAVNAAVIGHAPADEILREFDRAEAGLNQ